MQRTDKNADERMPALGDLHEQRIVCEFCVLEFRSSLRCETGSPIYNKFVANVFLPEK